MLRRPLQTTSMAPRPSPPDQKELEKRFTKVLNSMDLPPDKAKLLKSYDDNRKWEIILDQEKVTAKQPPEFYLKQLRHHLDIAGLKIPKTFGGNVKEAPSFTRKIASSFRLKKSYSDMTSTQVLRDLEISLRTNNIHWVRDFLSEQHNGLDVLVSYLSYALSIMRSEVMSSSFGEQEGTLSSNTLSRSSFLGISASSVMRKMKQSHSKHGLADAVDDIHVGVQCLRAIMNHQHGFNLVFQHKQAINCITLSLNHKNLRTKTLVLELLAAVCLVSGGHEIIFNAFDNFKEVCCEKRRFETLMRYFLHYEEFHIDFMVACMQFINIAVHSVEDINYRVHLQYEFTLLGLDQYLTTLSNSESDRLLIQVNAYLDNRIDVKLLLEDSDTKNVALDHALELEAEMSFLKEEISKKENDWLSKIVDLEKQLEESRSDMESFKELKESELALLREKLLSTKGIKEEDLNICLTPPTPPVPPPPPISVLPPVAPPPPPPGGLMGPPPPPPPLSSTNGKMSVVSIKKALQPRHRLPVLNWIVMKPNQVKGTVFAELDDEKLYKVIDFHKFEEVFKLGNLQLVYDDIDGTPKSERRFSRKPEAVSLLEPNRLRNVAITRRKIELSNESVVAAIQNLDLKTLSLERVEALLRVLPNDLEVKTIREYENDKRPIEILSDEDKFLILLTKVERLSQRLKIMSYVGNFNESSQHLQPQINAIIAASMSIKNSQKIKKVLEIVLALGNYMNSSKRGPAYGFKLQSFDAIVDTKSASDERRQTLMHFVATTIKEKFPELMNFDLELQCVEKASAVSLENVMADINELDKGMQLVLREHDGWKDRESLAVSVLRDFLSNAADQLKKLKEDSNMAQEQYASVVTYFGESPKTMMPSAFFSLFVRFAKAYRQAINDLESWKKQESSHQISFKDRIKMQQNGSQVASDIKRKNKPVKEKRVISREEVYHGALEDILLDLKNEPYRRADGMRRCNRTKTNQIDGGS